MVGTGGIFRVTSKTLGHRNMPGRILICVCALLSGKLWKYIPIGPSKGVKVSFSPHSSSRGALIRWIRS